MPTTQQILEYIGAIWACMHINQEISGITGGIRQLNSATEGNRLRLLELDNTINDYHNIINDYHKSINDYYTDLLERLPIPTPTFTTDSTTTDNTLEALHSPIPSIPILEVLVKQCLEVPGKLYQSALTNADRVLDSAPLVLSWAPQVLRIVLISWFFLPERGYLRLDDSISNLEHRFLSTSDWNAKKSREWRVRARYDSTRPNVLQAHRWVTATRCIFALCGLSWIATHDFSTVPSLLGIGLNTSTKEWIAKPVIYGPWAIFIYVLITYMSPIVSWFVNRQFSREIMSKQAIKLEQDSNEPELSNADKKPRALNKPQEEGALKPLDKE